MFMAENPEFKLSNYHNTPYQGSSTLNFKDKLPLEAGEYMNPAHTYNLHNRGGNSSLAKH